MKKLTLILCILFTGVIYSQFNGRLTIGYDTSSTSTIDSIETYYVGLGAKLINIKLKPDTNSVNVDSIKVRSGTIYTDGVGNPIDTVWERVAVRDSAWTIQTTLINDGDGAGFFLLSPVNQILEFTLMNAVSTNVIRKVEITIDVREKE